MPNVDLAFAAEEQAAILRHMNEDHPEDSALICRALGSQPGTRGAVMTGVDKAGMDFDATVDGGLVRVRVPWGHQLASRSEVRAQVVRIYRESCDALGIEPREAEGQH
jgi:putative heme iron utilization protein